MAIDPAPFLHKHGVLNWLRRRKKGTILDILAAAQLTSDGYELRLNGTPAEIKQRVKPGDAVLLVKKIKGN